MKILVWCNRFCFGYKLWPSSIQKNGCQSIISLWFIILIRFCRITFFTLFIDRALQKKNS